VLQRFSREDAQRTQRDKLRHREVVVRKRERERERQREREREHIEAEAGADTETTTKMRKRKNKRKNKQQKGNRDPHLAHGAPKNRIERLRTSR
jgi:hypothetical protein